MALLQLTMIPMGEGVSVGDHVSRIQEALEREGAKYNLNDMGTVIEGDIQELLALLGRIYETPFDQGAVRVVTQIVIDDRRDREIHIGDKIVAVSQRLVKTP